MKNGLRRVAGNKKLYRDLLMQFAAKHGDAGQQISAALESGDLKLAERMAHTVKGIAGNIGAMQIFSAAGRLEKALREEDTNASTVSTEFSISLSRQVQAIQRALPDVPRIPLQGNAGVAFDVNAATAAVARLKALLEDRDGEAEEAFLRLADALARVADEAQLNALGATISEFDFEGALSKLRVIALRHGVSGEWQK
jgi:HPt (histidine-containing phosphotransfer) domain-containing protein